MTTEGVAVRALWRLGLACALYCGAELVAVLTGLRLLEYNGTVALAVQILSVGMGISVELWLSALRAGGLRPGKPPVAFGFAYVVPVVAGFAGWAVRWLLWVSLLGFIALAGRALYLAGRARRSAGRRA